MVLVCISICASASESRAGDGGGTDGVEYVWLVFFFLILASSGKKLVPNSIVQNGGIM